MTLRSSEDRQIRDAYRDLKTKEKGASYFEPVPATPRKAMGKARRARIFLAHHGICGCCTKKILGPYEIDHIVALGIGGPDIDANCHPLCEECHKPKTKSDKGKIAKVKRLIRDGDPETRKATKRPIRSRGFDKTKTRKFDNSVVIRNAARIAREVEG